MPKKSKEQISQDDIKILTELQKYSSNSIGSIAEYTGFSKQKVWKSIKKLEEKKLIWGSTTITHEKTLGLQKFLLLIKRSMKKVNEDIVDTISLSRLDADYFDMGITIESSYYLHGEYDWAIIFTAKDLKHAKKFSSLLPSKYSGVITKVTLIQILYTQRSHYILNPNTKELRQFL
ncbi:MAG: AsnC family transcriptional regulator [Candidatus Thermoplasmatota archaeon]|nr:AsnC family transcriptional regulator [Candidatus Thermoplasmatota archaeon]